MRIRLLSFIAKVLGIQFKIEGIPYGAPYRNRDGFVHTGAQGSIRRAH